MGIWSWVKSDSGFGRSSSAEEVTEGIDASNLTAIVTGWFIDLFYYPNKKRILYSLTEKCITC
jgi:hypothetical protein